MPISTLRELWYEELRDLYSAEVQILEALPTMISNASNEELSEALSDHLDETREHKNRLEEIARSHDFKIEGHVCKGIKGILMEGTELVNKVTDMDTKDAAIIAAAQRVEHYEIAAYGVALAFARELDENDAADLLDDTLQEEGAADSTLNQVATGGLFSGGINEEANPED